MEIAIFQFALFGINTYVVFDSDTKDCAVIDPGMSSDEERSAIFNFIETKGMKVTHIINTHLHIDHAIGNRDIRDRYKVDTYASEDDSFLASRMREQASMFGINLNVEDVKIDHYLKDGDIIKIGNGELEVIAVPGHSPGGIALYDRKDGFLISGDSLFNGSIGRTDLPGGSSKQLLDSIKSRLMTLPADTRVYPGHGPATTIGREAKVNIFLQPKGIR